MNNPTSPNKMKILFDESQQPCRERAHSISGLEVTLQNREPCVYANTLLAKMKE